jgi:hypothetical protein
VRSAMSDLPHAAEIACLVYIWPSRRPGGGLDWLGVGILSHGSIEESRVPCKSGYSQFYCEGENTLVGDNKSARSDKKLWRLLNTQTIHEIDEWLTTKDRVVQDSKTDCFTAKSEDGRKVGEGEKDRPMSAKI